jgi:hypothetical protein
LVALSVVVTINVQFAGGVIVALPESFWAAIDATITSPESVPEGLLMLSDMGSLAVPLLALAAARNPMMGTAGQVSATSQSFAAGRHTAPTLPGPCLQLVLVPSQVSVEQALPSSVQAVPLGFSGFVDGQVVLVPVQVASRSQSPVAARQTAPALPAGCWQVALLPLQVSVVQALPSSGQAVPLGLNGFDGQVVLVPLQVAARSQSPAAARHWAPALPAGC